MKTGDVYVGRIYEVHSISDAGYYSNINLVYKEYALMITKVDFFGRCYMKDLNNGKRYNIKLPTKIGALYVSKTYLKSFNAAIDNEMVNMSKNKVLELGNKYIKENKEK